MRTFEEACALTRAVMQQRSPLLKQWRDVLDRYNGDWAIPLPNMDGEPILPPLTPMLMAESIDSISMRAASVWPYIGSPALDATKDRGKYSREYADIRRKALVGTWRANRGKLKVRRAFRQIGAYATSTLQVRPAADGRFPEVFVRNPLNTFPEPQDGDDLTPPSWCGFVYGRSADWVLKRWPELGTPNGGMVDPPRKGTQGELWDMLEWVDEDQYLFGVLGPRNVYGQDRRPHDVTTMFRQVDWMPNLMGTPGVSIPARVTLDRIVSQVGNMVGMLDLMAKLWALDLIAQEKSVFPDRYLLSRPGQRPRIVNVNGDDTWLSGETGQVNLLDGVQEVGVLRETPDPRTREAIDRLERNFRISSGLVPQLGGETYGALRTGRGIDALMGAAIDPRVHELHEIMEVAMEQANESILQCWRAYWGGRKVSLYAGWVGSGQFTFTPSTHVETTENLVQYPIPGADVQGSTIILGQMLATRGISLATFRQKHPWVDDPEFESRRVDEEDMERALFDGLVQQVNAGVVPVRYLAKVEKFRKRGFDIIEAIEKADMEASEEQAALQAEQMAAQPGLAPTPEMMPGLQAAPGAPPLPPAPIAGPNDSQQNFMRLVQALQTGA